MSLPIAAQNKNLPAGTPLDDADKNKSLLFSPITTKSVTAHNRIVVAPMCMYSAENGYMNDFHFAHLGAFALKGAGSVIIEATAVEPRGRISPHDLGLWEDGQIVPLKRTVEFIKAQGSVPGIQLAHAGRKASMGSPFAGYRLLTEEEGGWPQDVVAASDIPFDDKHAQPRALTLVEMNDIKQKWVDAAIRADKAGIELLQIHSAHGYLLHNFLSGNSNQRTDQYGGSLENRLRFPLEVIKAIRDVWPAEKPFWVRLSSTDNKYADSFAKDENGWDIYQAIEYSKELKKIGVDVIDCSSGGILANANYSGAGPCWQVPFSEIIKKEAGIQTGAVGIITKGSEGESILQENKADFIGVAREFLRNSGFVLTAARELGIPVKWANQYERADRERHIPKSKV
ncbi:uncharacterized protein BX664DRAFT_329881 [Halteromyces radiatus]|uniref:uncharacterized protein n=1 Tax=Halteromyces radiatus TaxID=101107 RepID=UPI00221EA552|nr:uncharacterized protein BX664DRAFT_329881 [Halteromyces radiatus]KAI8093511.1 hypothetical protein BX664DRAFT_329881 [Halteromyces radiatus]